MKGLESWVNKQRKKQASHREAWMCPLARYLISEHWLTLATWRSYITESYLNSTWDTQVALCWAPAISGWVMRTKRADSSLEEAVLTPQTADSLERRASFLSLHKSSRKVENSDCCAKPPTIKSWQSFKNNFFLSLITSQTRPVCKQCSVQESLEFQQKRQCTLSGWQPAETGLWSAWEMPPKDSHTQRLVQVCYVYHCTDLTQTSQDSQLWKPRM